MSCRLIYSHLMYAARVMADVQTAVGAARRACFRGAATIALVCVVGCSVAAPASPTSTPAASLAGTWSGTTFQGRPIAFTMSRDSQLTAISVGYQIDTCTGVGSFTNLAVPLFAVSGTGATGFAYGATLPDRPEVRISVQGFSMPDGGVAGGVIVYGLPSCGTSESVAGMFQATRR